MGFAILLALFIYVPLIFGGAFSFFLAALAIIRAIAPGRYFVGAPACTRCRYEIAGLESWTCPECGTDLRDTGVLTPGMSRRLRGSLWLALLSWSYIVLVLGGFTGLTASGFFFARSAMVTAQGISAAQSVTLASPSGAFASLDIDTHDDISPGDGVMSVVLVLKRNDDAGEFVLSIDEQPRRYEALGTDGSTILSGEDIPDADAIAQWLGELGIEAPPDEVQDIADVAATGASGGIIAPASLTMTSQAFNSVNTGFGATPPGAIAGLAVGVGAWLLVYALGVFGIVWLRRWTERRAIARARPRRAPAPAP